MRRSKFPLDQRRELATQFRAIQGREARAAFAAGLGVSPAVVYGWATELLGRVRSWGPRDKGRPQIDMHALFPAINGTQEASGRVHEFRLVDDQLQQLGADGRWERYIPFRAAREQLGQRFGLSAKARAGNRRRWERFYAAHKNRLATYRKRWAADHREQERKYARRKLAARKADPQRWAVYQARQERHREKKRARARQRYLEQMGIDNRGRDRKGNTRCGHCQQAGHNVRRCPGRQEQRA